MSGELRDKKSGKSTRNSDKRSGTDYSPATFINRELTKEEAAACKSQTFGDSEHVAALDRILDDGYKVTFTFDDYHNCFVCALVPVGRDHKHTGRILTGRGSAASKAFKQALFIHYVLFDAIWPTTPTRRELEIDD